ncbi:hypothetical protein CJO71_07070 [Burkholderia ubonensis]|uniref:Uncharacterized protein n=1 Tax=Burkholderia ubonensis TaxID=101571 RepID=A0AB74D534_9BURK|nr:hypothetical protein CJO71_07070 [Burkholderia ubonensis]PAJ88517.1 hypothetical protein CJO70_06835 [Burkholderia ubonensis]PAJ94947.1 hypothetical protein CJO69_08545 [Burkholderia ubonensis]PAJ99229.1 hypothetical protein CJO68_21560 [Burkholderia ubonensis]PAK08864.1 hypothetical protein CJO67_05900 [Burkholderia ubonensis]
MRIGVPRAVLLCRRPFVGPPGWGLQFSRGDARPSSASPPNRPPTAARNRVAAIAHENPASV